MVEYERKQVSLAVYTRRAVRYIPAGRYPAYIRTDSRAACILR